MYLLQAPLAKMGWIWLLLSVQVQPALTLTWTSYVTSLASEYVLEAKHGKQLYEALSRGVSVTRRIMEKCVTHPKSIPYPPLVGGDIKYTVFHPCGWISGKHNKLEDIKHSDSEFAETKWVLAVPITKNTVRVNITFYQFNLLFSLNKCTMESVRLTKISDWFITEPVHRLCGHIPLGSILLTPFNSGVLIAYRKHTYSNSSFLATYQMHTFPSKEFAAGNPRITKYVAHDMLMGTTIQALSDRFSYQYYMKEIFHFTAFPIQAVSLYVLYPDNLPVVTECYQTYVYDGPSVHFPILTRQVHKDLKQTAQMKKKSSEESFKVWHTFEETSGFKATAEVIQSTTYKCISRSAFTGVDIKLLYDTTSLIDTSVILTTESAELVLPMFVSFPNRNCSVYSHLTLCGLMVSSMNAPGEDDTYLQASVTDLTFPGVNTQDCDFAGVLFASYSMRYKGINDYWHSPVLCRKYLLKSDSGWKKRLPFQTFTTEQIYHNGSRITIVYYSYRNQYRTVTEKVELEISTTPCQGLGIRCTKLPNKDSEVTYNRPDITDIRYEIPIGNICYRGSSTVQECDTRRVMTCRISNDIGMLTSIYVKHRHTRTCLKIQKYPTVAGFNPVCGYMFARDSGQYVRLANSYTVSGNRHLTKASGQIQSSDSPFNGFWSVLVHSIPKETSTNVNHGPYYGLYVLKGLHSTMMCANNTQFSCGTTVSHYDVPAMYLDYLHLEPWNAKQPYLYPEGFRLNHLLFMQTWNLDKLYISNQFKTGIEVLLHGCDYLEGWIAIKQQTLIPWFSSLWCQTVIYVELRRGKSFLYIDTLNTEQRHIVMNFKADPKEDSCSVNVRINPKVLQPELAPVDRPQDTNIDRTYYVITGQFEKSWMEVQELCELTGGQLPSVIDEGDSTGLESMILRSIKGENRHFGPPCRYLEPFCGVFIGLKNDKVSDKIRAIVIASYV